MATETKRPNIQIDDVVRPMTDEEYEALLDSGWTPGDDNATSEPA